jgi:hypothetical protein
MYREVAGQVAEIGEKMKKWQAELERAEGNLEFLKTLGRHSVPADRYGWHLHQLGKECGLLDNCDDASSEDSTGDEGLLADTPPKIRRNARKTVFNHNDTTIAPLLAVPANDVHVDRASAERADLARSERAAHALTGCPSLVRADRARLERAAHARACRAERRDEADEERRQHQKRFKYNTYNTLLE